MARRRSFPPRMFGAQDCRLAGRLMWGRQAGCNFTHGRLLGSSPSKLMRRAGDRDRGRIQFQSQAYRRVSMEWFRRAIWRDRRFYPDGHYRLAVRPIPGHCQLERWQQGWRCLMQCQIRSESAPSARDFMFARSGERTDRRDLDHQFQRQQPRRPQARRTLTPPVPETLPATPPSPLSTPPEHSPGQ